MLLDRWLRMLHCILGRCPCLGSEGTGPLTLHLMGKRARLHTESAPLEWKEEWYAGMMMMAAALTADTVTPPNIYHFTVINASIYTCCCSGFDSHFAHL